MMVFQQGERAYGSDAACQSGVEMFSRIFVGIDGTPPSVTALAEAIRLAQTEAAAIRAVSVVEAVQDVVGWGPGFGDPTALARARYDAVLAATDRARDLFALTGVKGDSALVKAESEDIASTLLHEAGGWGADLIVLGSHGRYGLTRVLMGSVAEDVLRRATIPVLIVPTRQPVETMR